MGQFTKRVALFGCVVAGTCGVANAQSTWQWPSRPAGGVKVESTAALWDQLPANRAATPVLVGPSDFQFPPQSPGLIEPPIEAAVSQASPTPAPSTTVLSKGHSWDRVLGRNAPPRSSSPKDAPVAKHVNWESIYGNSSSAQQKHLQPQTVVSAVPEPSPSDWFAPFETAEQDAVRPPADLKMVGPMDQVAPTVIAAEQHSAAIAMPSTEQSSQGSLIVDNLYPQPGTELVTPIELNVASGSMVSPAWEPAVESEPEPQSPSVSLLNMQAVETVNAPTETEASLAEVVVGMSGQRPGSYVLQSVKASLEKAQPETIVPIDIIPFNRLIASQAQSAGVGRTYTAAAMTGPLNDVGLLFSKLHINEDFRQQPFVPAGAVRTSTDPFSAGSEWMQHNYAWVTPTFYHHPLYFEQTNLERYGIGTKRWLQPVHSAAHFFGSIGLMPYKLTTQHPHEHVYTLGHGRPGDCVRFQRKTLLGQSYPMEALRYFDDYSGYN